MSIQLVFTLCIASHHNVKEQFVAQHEDRLVCFCWKCHVVTRFTCLTMNKYWRWYHCSCLWLQYIGKQLYGSQ